MQEVSECHKWHVVLVSENPELAQALLPLVNSSRGALSQLRVVLKLCKLLLKRLFDTFLETAHEGTDGDDTRLKLEEV